MTKREIRESLKKLIDEANVVAPSIDNFEKDGSYESVTDDNLYWESLVSWETEAQAILAQLSKLNSEVFSTIYNQYSEIKEQSKKNHSKSILVHKIQQLLIGAYRLLSFPPGKLNSIEEIYKDKTKTSDIRTKKMANNRAKDTSKVFVVHGRNAEARKAIFSFLRSIELKPVEWNEAIAITGNASPFIGEILEKAFSEAQAIVVLLTGDDLVRLGTRYATSKKELGDLVPQPRPNVLFEAGMAIGRDPNRSILVQLGEIRPFSDIAGRHIVHLNNSAEKRQELISRLQIAGCNIDITHKTDWLSTGDFESCVIFPDKDKGRKNPQNELKQNYQFEDLKRQRELLLEFLGTPKSEFNTLRGAGNTWDAECRRNKIQIISGWVEQNRPFFPKQVQKALTSIANFAGTMFTDDGLKLALRSEGIESATESFKIIENYAEELENKLDSK